MDPLVSTESLAQRLGARDLIVVDSSWHMPASGRSARDEYLAGHIPGARFLDIDELSDHANPAPHMLPSAGEFGAAMERLGIGRGDGIVVYDNSPLRSAARGWFMLRHFGADRVGILDGGMQKWLAECRPTESGEPPKRDVRFEAIERRDVIIRQQLLGGPNPPLLDARGQARFEGREPEPRSGLASGHMPGARNLPFSALYDDRGCFKPLAELGRLFHDAGIDPNRLFVASCGSGVTAAALLFAAHLLGNDSARLYDGSWSEWGADPATPKATGPG